MIQLASLCQQLRFGASGLLHVAQAQLDLHLWSGDGSQMRTVTPFQKAFGISELGLLLVHPTIGGPTDRVVEALVLGEMDRVLTGTDLALTVSRSIDPTTMQE